MCSQAESQCNPGMVIQEEHSNNLRSKPSKQNILKFSDINTVFINRAFSRLMKIYPSDV